MFSTKRLKKKSQSVDMTTHGFGSPMAADGPSSQTDKNPTLKTITSEEHQNNASNTQRRNTRRSELKRYYTIGDS
uniref:oxidation resistance protein 1-like n=1 Tax=Pristiophorus japonicus TaxID=55135 RepID=UPI00398E495F